MKKEKSEKETKDEKPTFDFTDSAKMREVIDDIDDFDRWINHDWISTTGSVYANFICDDPKEAKKAVDLIEWWIVKTNAVAYILEEITDDTCTKDSNGEDRVYGVILTGAKYEDINGRKTKLTAAATNFYYTEDVSDAMKKNFIDSVVAIKDFLRNYKKDEGAFFQEGTANDSFVPIHDEIITPPSAICSGWIDIDQIKAKKGKVRVSRMRNTESNNGEIKKFSDLYEIDVMTEKRPVVIEPKKKKAKKGAKKVKKAKAVTKMVPSCLMHVVTGVKVDDILSITATRSDIVSKRSIPSLLKMYLTK